MDIKLKYKAWIGEKHADIAHTLMGNDIEIFALEFAEHLLKNCSIPVVVGKSEQLFCKCGFEKNGSTVPCIRTDCDNILVGSK